MPYRRWEVDWSGKNHAIELKWSLAECSGEIKVDGQVAKSWSGARSMPGAIAFEMEGTQATFKRKRAFMFIEDYDLHLGGKKYEAIVTS